MNDAYITALSNALADQNIPAFTEGAMTILADKIAAAKTEIAADTYASMGFEPAPVVEEDFEEEIAEDLEEEKCEDCEKEEEDKEEESEDEEESEEEESDEKKDEKDSDDEEEEEDDEE